jgi:glycosyltransferase involved in cell wall biosynthesis
MGVDNNKEYKYSIIIPTWNNLSYLKNTIKSILNNSKFKHQIIVHINEGVDGTLEWIKQQPYIDYTYSEKNIGVCYALNIARPLMKTDYLVYVNDDMYLAPNWDFYFDNEIKNIPSKYFFLSGTLMEPESTNNAVIVKDFGKDLESFDEDTFNNECQNESIKDWNGATWPINIVHKDIWDMVGGYSVEYSPGFYSDPDFSKKLWDLGVRYFKGMSKVRVYHFPSQSTKRVKKKNKGRVTFLLKWGITANYFYNNFLKMGTPFVGELPDFNKKSIINKIKFIIEAVKL